MTANRIGMTAAALAVLAGAAPLAADQDSYIAMRSAAMAPPSGPEQADQLKLDAEALFSQPKEWKRAVRMLQKSAALRDADDPDGYICLLYAGRISSAVGDMEGARENLEAAAAQALARGSIVEAANAYIDAAHAAVALRDMRGAQALVDKAALLTESPLLSEAQRSVLEMRLPA